MLERPVLPDPGIPLIAIINRVVSGVVRSFANTREVVSQSVDSIGLVKMRLDQSSPQVLSSNLSTCCSMIERLPQLKRKV